MFDRSFFLSLGRKVAQFRRDKKVDVVTVTFVTENKSFNVASVVNLTDGHVVITCHDTDKIPGARPSTILALSEIKTVELKANGDKEGFTGM